MVAGARFCGCVVAATIASGCAARRPQSVAERFVQRGRERTPPTVMAKADHSIPQSLEQREALAEAVARLQQLAVAPQPPRMTGAVTLESYDTALAAARTALTLQPTAAHHRLVGDLYAKRHVLDMAYDQYTAALRLNSKDAWTYDGRARVWRDWGFAGLGLSDAYHAVYLAPTSPVPQNTLGTLFLKIGLVDEARAAFARALALDPNASYALENLCRLAAAKDGAVDRCPRGR